MSELRIEERDRILIMTMDRPRSHNSISEKLSHEIADAIRMLDDRTDLRVGVITGANGTFSSGMDLKGFAKGERPIVEGRGFAGIAEKPPMKPLIAAVEGFALAGGFEVVLCCDLVVASHEAVFGLPEVRRGLSAAGGGLLRLAQRIPYHLAMELVLTGRMWSANQAAEVYLVNRLTEPGQALDRALELAEEVAANAPMATTASKQVMIRSVDWPSDEMFDRQESFVGPIRDSADAKEGALAFVEKRLPKWTGE